MHCLNIVTGDQNITSEEVPKGYKFPAEVSIIIIKSRSGYH